MGRRRLRAAAGRLTRRLLYSRDRRRRYGPLPMLASTLRRWKVLLTHPHARIRFEGRAYLGPGFSVHIPAGGQLIVGPDVEFRRNFVAEIEGEGVLRIGARVVFTYGTLFQCTRSIEVGDGAMIGSATIVDGKHRFRDPDRPVGEQGYDWHPLVIGDGAVIHSYVTVMANIGERSVIGANAVVTREVPPFSVAAGVPARVISEIAAPARA